MIKIFLEFDKLSHKAGVTKHATNNCLAQPLAAKSKLYLLAMGLFSLIEIDERRISGA